MVPGSYPGIPGIPPRKQPNRKMGDCQRKTLHLAFHHLVHDPVNLPKQKTESQNFKKSENKWCYLYLLSYIVIYHIDIRIYSVILSDLCMLVFLIYTSLSIDFVSSPLSSSWEPKAACTQGSWHGVIRIFWELTISPAHNFKQRKQAGFFLHKLVETFF